MHLVTHDAQAVSVAGEYFSFCEGETIFTESSYKYTLEEFHALAADSGWQVVQVWTDEGRLFSVQYMTTT
jgi:uncharacterized SAM-dependent methyltransferase